MKKVVGFGIFLVVVLVVASRLNTQASQIWSSAEGQNLFVYDPQGDLSINLIYDERQSLTKKIIC